MKKIVLTLSAIAFIGVTSCDSKKAVDATDAQETAVAAEDAALYKVDTQNSEVTWRAYKIYEGETEEQGHYGNVRLTSGDISVEDNQIVAGDFVIDNKTFESQDLNEAPDDKAKLDKHLLSEDFLDVEKYPTATFSITQVTPIEGEYNYEISGNLQLREVEKNITFKANVVQEDHQLKINSEEFTINRQDFGVSFKGGKGAVIKDNVTLQVKVVADHQM